MALNFFSGLVRKLTVPAYSDLQQATPGMNSRGELLVNQGLPERTELIRQGNSWSAQLPTGSAFTFVATWPTTRAELVLSNAEGVGGKTYIIDRVWMVAITDQTAAQNMSILGQINPASNGIAAGSNNTAILRQQLSGSTTSYGGNARLLLASTAFALTNLWFLIGSSAQVAPATNNKMAGMEAHCYGSYLIPPGAQFCLAAVASAATGTAIMGVDWHEVQLP